MAANQEWGGAGQGGFLRILGIIYLVKLIKQRRRERRARAAAAAEHPGQDGPGTLRAGRGAG